MSTRQAKSNNERRQFWQMVIGQRIAYRKKLNAERYTLNANTIGNVWEWCQDWYGDDYYASSPSTDPTGASSGTSRVLRSGSWNHARGAYRSAYRTRHNPTGANYQVGFRVVRLSAR